MTQSLLIIVSGPPCSGKTTLVTAIAQKFNLPLITKDSLKEILFDTVGWKDREWSKKIGSASFSIMHYILDSLMATGQSIIIEGNFKTEFESQYLSPRLNKYNYHSVQIMCQCDGQILFKRFKQRSESGNRHPGHCDTDNYDELKKSLLLGKYPSLDLKSKTIIFDSTNLNNLNYNQIFNQISSLI
ncbi:MAG: AAA family ATPase [Candidatus Shapirobacteria bacterium]|nr:AAA family ATPase [Candidatus Shapirobacteria bacterium]